MAAASKLVADAVGDDVPLRPELLVASLGGQDSRYGFARESSISVPATERVARLRYVHRKSGAFAIGVGGHVAFVDGAIIGV